MREKMPKAKMEWCYYNHDGKMEPLNIQNIEKEDYEAIYKGKLSCIEGCEARIKFTQRINGKKFLSTWNKEGEKHNPDNCPYHINYKGIIGRKNLIEKQEKVKFSEEQVMESLKRKIRNLQIEFNGEDLPKDKANTNRVKNTGEGEEVSITDDESGLNGTGASKGRITYIQAETINGVYHRHYRGVVGEVDNIQYGYTNGEFWAYINLKNRYNRTNVYFPESYYEGNEFRLDELKRVLDILKIKKEKNSEKIVIGCYGQIKLKEGTLNDFNINIINPKHIIVNGSTMNEIHNTGIIKSFE
ncbi:hypothetical protein psyc5s11_53710 [Clostridium gelidum]|uniref:Uncharacterized protein n=1 Tax=Clostridium gelidum TaxID=704125 RepID=A0ABN6J8N4_9CLOT|nr:hypothetical protein [Clostridium gelidum]BCZ49304.1 hypothetical protein psyc5s11_53710 [Clostridium gelidum]